MYRQAAQLDGAGPGRPGDATLRTEGSPLVGIDTLAGVPHAVPSARSGAERIRDLVLSECRVR